LQFGNFSLKNRPPETAISTFLRGKDYFYDGRSKSGRPTEAGQEQGDQIGRIFEIWAILLEIRATSSCVEEVNYLHMYEILSEGGLVHILEK
jgi:hypothetical protein